jgi:hypothetical protein
MAVRRVSKEQKASEQGNASEDALHLKATAIKCHRGEGCTGIPA